MAVLLFSILLLLGVLPALFFLDRLFQINFDRGVLRRPGAKGVFWTPKNFVGGREDTKPKKGSIKSAFEWIYRNPPVANDDLEAFRYLIFYRMSIAFTALIVAVGLAYFLMV